MSEDIYGTPFYGSPLEEKPEGDFWLGFDCGQVKDHSALALLRTIDGTHYQLIHLERLPLDMSYPEQVEHVFRLMHRKPLDRARKNLVIDQTGVGRPIFDLASTRGLNPIGLSITGGDSVTWQDDNTRVRVPKRDLVSTLQVFAQNNRLKIAKGLAVGPTLAQELQNFKVKIDLQTAHDSYGCWRENEHDDLILATAISLWTAVNKPLPRIIVRFISSGPRSRW